MINFKKIMPSLLGAVAVATIADATSIFDGISVLESLVNFFTMGSAGAALAVAAVTTGEMGGSPVSTATVADGVDNDDEREAASYLEEDLNSTLVLVRPQDVPIDTITRTIGNVEKCESWEAGGWEIGTRSITDEFSAVTNKSVTVTAPDMWLVGDTFVIMTPTGPYLDGAKPVSAIITDKSGDVLSVERIGETAIKTMPSISSTSNMTLLRLSRAVSELTASVTGFAIQPTDRKFFNQTHMCQVEESVIHSIHKKKVSMDFSTYKEQTLWDFKRGMEFANLFQVGGITKDKEGALVHLATGIWWQMENEYQIDYSKAYGDAEWNELAKNIFEGNNGSDRRFLFAGPELMLHISKIPAYNKQLEAKNTEVVLGVRVYKIETPFGELLVKPMGTLFEGYFEKCGMVVDVNYLKKYVMEPLTATVLELDKTGQRRVKNAVRMHETYSLFLENLPVHCRLVPKA